MSDDALAPPRFQIAPDPTAAELVAILTSLQADLTDPSAERAQPTDRWCETARREQMRVPLDVREDSWSR
ncbi:MAG: hypothetical protein M9947_03255 [Thermomicrobiales bacterium]|nr:hypothetical protein [Thermomicrobiales bacterium]